jgi:hypothetical protein
MHGHLADGRIMDNQTSPKPIYIKNLKNKSQTLSGKGFKMAISELQHAKN